MILALLNIIAESVTKAVLLLGDPLREQLFALRAED